MLCLKQSGHANFASATSDSFVLEFRNIISLVYIITLFLFSLLSCFVVFRTKNIIHIALLDGNRLTPHSDWKIEIIFFQEYGDCTFRSLHTRDKTHFIYTLMFHNLLVCCHDINM